jgi:hypothetical protein
MHLQIKFIKLGETQPREGTTHCEDYSHLMKLLGHYGYHVISCYEKPDSPDDIKRITSKTTEDTIHEIKQSRKVCQASI